MRDVKFSIIIPAYNAEKYIRECLDSVLRQSYAPYEIIIMNDGSTDSTEDIVNSYILKYRNSHYGDSVLNTKDEHLTNHKFEIKYFKHDNVGLGATRNKGIDKATGDYVLFLDSDDLLEPTTLECCKDRIIKDGADLVHFEFKNYYDDGRISYVLYNKHLLSKDLLKGSECELLLKNSFYFSTTSAIKLSLIKDNNIKFGEGYFFEDHVFFIKVVMLADTISLIHAPFYFYRRHDSAITSAEKGKAGHVEGRKRVIMETYDLIEELNLSEHAKSEIVQHHYMGFLTTYLKNTAKEDEKEFLTWFVDYMSDIRLTDFNLDDMNFLHIYNEGWFENKKYRKIDSFIKKDDKRKKKEKEKKKKDKEKADLKKQDYQFVLSEAKKDVLEDTVLFVTVGKEASGELYNEFIKYCDENHDKKVLFAYKGKETGEKLVLRSDREYLTLLARSSKVITDDLNISIRKVRDNQEWTFFKGSNSMMTSLFCAETESLPEDKYKLRKKEYDRTLKYDHFIVQSEQEKNEIVKSHLISDIIISVVGN